MSEQISRKKFFQQIVSNSCDALIDSSFFTHFEPMERPPGAHPENSQFKNLCTGCDLCMIACPVNCIVIEDRRSRHPVIFPERDPCQHCADTPCITACPTGALQKEFYEDCRQC